MAGQRSEAGALFMVGDPKQSIYRFRGADVGSYTQARAAIERQWPDNIVQITANFRSRPAILTHINQCFEAPLSAATASPVTWRSPRRSMTPDHDLPCAAKITIDVPPDSRPAQIRDAEAEAVAELCARLIGNLHIRDDDGDYGAAHPRRHRPARADRRRTLALRTRARSARPADRLPGGQEVCSGARRCRIWWRWRAYWPTPATPWPSAP